MPHITDKIYLQLQKISTAKSRVDKLGPLNNIDHANHLRNIDVWVDTILQLIRNKNVNNEHSATKS